MNNTHQYNIQALLGSPVVSKKAKAALRVLDKEGTMVKTAKVLGIRKRSLQQLLSNANKKFMAVELDSVVPENQLLKGTSTLYKVNEDTGEKEVALQWVKTSVDRDNELEMIKSVTSELANKVEGLKEPTERPANVMGDLLVTYVTTDLHLGQYSWHEETGNDVNVDTIVGNTVAAMKVNVDTSPDAEKCIVLDIGDTMHSANDANRTKSGHELDVDSRHAKIFKALVDMKIAMIDMALKKHARVRYVVVPGNHSDLVPNYLMAMLSAYYRNEPRFEVDESPAMHKYYRFGEVLLGFTHGHTSKMARLPEVMVWDRKEDISSTTYRYWLTGHIHQDKVIDGGIARCEAFRNNTNNDAWAQAAGYRGHKQTTSITYHRDYGEIGRNICPIKLIK